jgi:hypothetical protein
MKLPRGDFDVVAVGLGVDGVRGSTDTLAAGAGVDGLPHPDRHIPKDAVKERARVDLFIFILSPVVHDANDA